MRINNKENKSIRFRAKQKNVYLIKQCKKLSKVVVKRIYIVINFNAVYKSYLDKVSVKDMYFIFHLILIKFMVHNLLQFFLNFIKPAFKNHDTSCDIAIHCNKQLLLRFKKINDRQIFLTDQFDLCFIVQTGLKTSSRPSFGRIFS